MSEGFSTQVLVRAPVERVWRALRDPAEIRLWHGWDDPGLDDEVRFIYVDNATEGDEPYVLEVDPLETFTLDPHEDGTVLRLDRAPRERSPEWADSYDAISEGWTSFLQQLRFALERHPGRGRRTLFWTGSGEPQSDLVDDGALPSPVLGRWFTSDRQLGLVLDALGPGLLVLARQDAAHGGPGAMATLSTRTGSTRPSGTGCASGGRRGSAPPTPPRRYPQKRRRRGSPTAHRLRSRG